MGREKDQVYKQKKQHGNNKTRDTSHLLNAYYVN